jgi:ferric-dicitrate binding protein FerR (iron transport regulator)
MPDANLVAIFRKQFENFSDNELLHEMAQWVPHSERHLAAKQALREREIDIEKAQTQRALVLAEEAGKIGLKTLGWTKIGAIAAIVAAVAAIISIAVAFR